MAATPTTNTHDDDSKNNIKVVSVGDTGVGQTCFLMTLCTGEFPHSYVPTVWDNYQLHREWNGVKYTLGLWDTAGDDDYAPLRPLTYCHTDVFIIMYSIMSRSSLNHVQTKWIQEIQEHVHDDAVTILVATKDDLRVNEGTVMVDVIAIEEGQLMAKKIGAYAHMVISSLQNRGLTHVIDKCIEVKMCSTEFKARKKRKTCIIL